MDERLPSIGPHLYSDLKNALDGGLLAVRCDSFDIDALEENLLENEEVKIKEFMELMPAADALVQDLFSAYFKAMVRLESHENLRPSARSNHIIIEAVINSETFRKLKVDTFLNERNSISAAIASAEKLMDELQNLNLSMAKYLSRLEASTITGLRLLSGKESKKRTEFCKRRASSKVEERDVDDDGEEIVRRITDETKFIGRISPPKSIIDEWGIKGGGVLNLLPFHERLSLKRELMAMERFQKFLKLAIDLPRITKDSFRRELERGAEEVHDVTTGKEIARLLPVELTSLTRDVMKKAFYKKFFEGELLQYNILSKQSRGPIIVCVDTSHSMEGDKEMLAKAFALALRDVASEQDRAFLAILFGAKTQEVKLIQFERTGTDDIIELAEFYYGGGTDFQAPLKKALSIQQRSLNKKGDIIFLTDGQCELDEEFTAELLREKKRLDIKILTIIMDAGTSTDISLKPPVSDLIKRSSEFIAHETQN